MAVIKIIGLVFLFTMLVIMTLTCIRRIVVELRFAFSKAPNRYAAELAKRFADIDHGLAIMRLMSLIYAIGFGYVLIWLIEQLVFPWRAPWL